MPERGGYVLADTNGSCDVVLIGTGSEVAVCLDAAVRLADRGVAARVVSMPCVELFADQPADYRSAVLPAGAPALSVEAGVTLRAGTAGPTTASASTASVPRHPAPPC